MGYTLRPRADVTPVTGWGKFEQTVLFDTSNYYEMINEAVGDFDNTMIYTVDPVSSGVTYGCLLDDLPTSGVSRGAKLTVLARSAPGAIPLLIAARKPVNILCHISLNVKISQGDTVLLNEPRDLPGDYANLTWDFRIPENIGGEIKVEFTPNLVGGSDTLYCRISQVYLSVEHS